MKEIDYIYKNFDPVVFSKNLEKVNINTKDERGLDFLAGIVLDSVRDINQLKNKINLYQFTDTSEDKVFNNFVKKFNNNYSDRDIKKYFFEQMNILNTRIKDYTDIESLLEQHVNCGEFFRNFNKYFQIIFYAQVTYTNHTYDDEQYGQFRDYYCLHIKSIKKYYLFSFNYHDRVMEMQYTGISKIFKYRPSKSELIKILELGDERIHPDKKEIRVKQCQTFNYDKSYNRIYSEGHKLKHKTEPHFLNEEDYFNYHNIKGDSHIAQKMAVSKPEQYFKKYFKSLKQVSNELGGKAPSSFAGGKPVKIKGKIKDNNFFKFVMSDIFNYRDNKKFIEDIIYSYDDLEGFLEHIPKKTQESKLLKDEIRILRLFRGNNKNFIIKVFHKNKDKLEGLVENYMPSTIFDDSYLMIELIKLSGSFSADIGNKLKNNKKFMKKVKKLLDK